MSFNPYLSSTFIEYSPHDFIYVDAIKNGASYAPDTNCTILLQDDYLRDPSCSFVGGNLLSGNIITDIIDSPFADNSFNCIKKQLCVNQQLAQSLPDNYSLDDSSNTKYSDSKQTYYNYLTKTINLGIGIAVISYLIIKSRPVLQ